MSLYKREDSSIWWVRFTHKGKRVQQSSGTPVREKAEEYEAKLKSSLWEQERLGAKPIYKWNDAVVRYLGETQHKASQISDIDHLRWLDQHLDGIELQEIKRDLLDKISATKLASGVANATVNRVLAVKRFPFHCRTWQF